MPHDHLTDEDVADLFAAPSIYATPGSVLDDDFDDAIDVTALAADLRGVGLTSIFLS